MSSARQGGSGTQGAYNSGMKTGGDVVILGGGVIGLTTAFYLAHEGASVVLCDAGRAGHEASWAGAGIIPPSDLDHAAHPFDRLRGLSVRLFPHLSATLAEQTGIDNGYRVCGGLEWVESVGEADAAEWYGAGVPTERLDEDAVHALEPALAPKLGPALRVPGMAQLRNPRHLQALRAACLRSGRVTLIEDTPAGEFVIERGAVRGVRTTADILQGEHYLVAAGAWADLLLAPLGLRLGVVPVRGQIALLNLGRMLFRHVLVWGARYLVPRLDGRVLVGSTEERVGFEKRTTAEGIRDLLALALRLIPALAAADVERCWAGLRPGSPDGLPFLGRVPGHANVLVAAGHFRAGIQLSPGTGWLLKELILGQPSSLPLEPFRLDRERS